jgi:cytosine/adenosine deaminase-related metal-dependent hydrolase
MLRHSTDWPNIVLINAHTHLEFSSLSHLCPTPDAPFGSWLARAGQGVRGRDAEWFRNACELGIQRLLEAGTTHVGDISWSGASVEPLARSGMKGIVWLEMRGVVRSQGEKRLASLRRRLDTLRLLAANTRIEIGIEVHSPYTLHPELWEPVLRWVENDHLPLCIHAAESPEEWQLFQSGGGKLAFFEALMAVSDFPGWLRYSAAHLVTLMPQRMRAVKPVLKCFSGTTPVEYLERLGVLQLRPTLVHMVQVSDEDIHRVARCGATVVHCPRSNVRLRCGRMPLEKYLAAGIPVLLGTDSLASSPSLDIRDETAAAKDLHAHRVKQTEIEALARKARVFEGLMSATVGGTPGHGCARRAA